MVWSYVSQMVSGLDACHYRGSQQQASSSGSVSPTEEAAIPATAVLHRDLKPENVFLDGNQNIKIGDFGLSKEVAAQSFACTYVGTPYYMSPELATGSPYDIKADIWALGCVAFELCALAPPFDARDQAELTRKIKLGHVPELPRGYSSDLGNLIRSMLDLNPKRRPTTKHLLREHPIRLACRTIELSAMSRKIAAEKVKLRAQYYELEMREHALAAREQEVASMQASTSRERERETELEERERNVEAREKAVQVREERWEQNQNHAREMAASVDKVKSHLSEEASSRERTSSNNHHAVGSAIRKPMTRRISANAVARARPCSGSNWAEGATETTHTRPAIITPRSHKAEAARQRFGKGAGGGLPALGNIRASDKAYRQRLDSVGSEEWVDNEGEAEGPVRSLDSSHGEQSKDVTSRSRRRSSAATASLGGGETTDEPLERFSSRRSSRKSITALPPAARAWVNEVAKGGAHEGDEEDVSMRDASAYLLGEDKENSYRHLEMGFDKRQSLPASVLNEEARVVPRPALTSRSTVATEAINGAVDGVIPPPPAIYDLSNDEDLPSPFLRKVTRQSNEVLAKRGAKGSGLVGPSNFLARAAAAGAARQIMAAAVKDSEKAEQMTTTKPSSIVPMRRMSAVAASAIPSGRVKAAMPTSSSAADIRSIVEESAPIIKRRASAIPGSIGLSAPLKPISARKSCLPTSNLTVRQRAA
jgi:hypothetical protein